MATNTDRRHRRLPVTGRGLVRGCRSARPGRRWLATTRASTRSTSSSETARRGSTTKCPATSGATSAARHSRRRAGTSTGCSTAYPYFEGSFSYSGHLDTYDAEEGDSRHVDRAGAVSPERSAIAVHRTGEAKGLATHLLARLGTDRPSSASGSERQPRFQRAWMRSVASAVLRGRRRRHPPRRQHVALRCLPPDRQRITRPTPTTRF